MQQTTALRVNWLNVNVPTIVALFGVGWGVVSYISDINSRLEQVEFTQSQGGQQAKEAFNRIQLKLETIDDLPYRMTTVEGQIAATNQRIDRLVESLTNSVELLRKDVGALSTKVEVLTSKIDAISPTKPANFPVHP